MARRTPPKDAPKLIDGYYRCDRCGKTVLSVERYRGWRLCPRCVQRIVPSAAPLRGGDGTIRTEQERAEAARFWGWYWRKQARRPKRYFPPGKAPQDPLENIQHDSYHPLCECGRPREELGSFTSRPRGLFGGPYTHFCTTCDSRRMVESLVPKAGIFHPEWDDEDWLDHLRRVFPEAFEVGVLPQYWFEFRRQERLAAQKDDLNAGSPGKD